MNFLIDTNILIGLEDNRIVKTDYAEFSRLADKHKIGLYVHQASIEDIQQDKTSDRRAIVLSKIDKYQRLNKLTDNITEFGPTPKRNDEVDVQLLYSLKRNAADFLITEDKGIHSRARKYAPQLRDRIFFLADAIDYIRRTYEPKPVPIQHIEDIEAHDISRDNPFFDSLKEDYPGFAKWWDKCCKNHRKCWVVFNGKNAIAGLIVYKTETGKDTDAIIKADKILKICTFKVSPDNQGIKLGELLLRKALWYAQKNNFGLTYLTTFKKQAALRNLLEYYGFKDTSKKGDEYIYEKLFSKAKLLPQTGQTAYDTVCLNYPRFITDSVPAFIIPIQKQWHDILFPDLIEESSQLMLDLELQSLPRRPGNAIRKVYICRAQTNLMPNGSILFFYKSKPSQTITVIGILEKMELAHSTEELIRLTGERSVYSRKELEDYRATEKRPVKVLNFLLVKDINTPIPLAWLRRNKIIRSHHPPQSIAHLENTSAHILLKEANLDFSV